MRLLDVRQKTSLAPRTAASHDDMLQAMEAAKAHALFRLLVVLLVLGVFGYASYHVTLATEQLFRIYGGALR